MTTHTVEDLNMRFGLEDQLVFSRHHSGLVRGTVKTGASSGEFFLLGAHVSAFQPSDQSSPLLFMSSESMFEEGKPIRGGVPICFPWFGPNKLDASAPGHGLARLAAWEVHKTQRSGESISIELGVTVGKLKLAYRVAFGAQLDLSLAVTNIAEHRQDCEAALHTYFQLADVKAVKVCGLESLAYLDTLVHKAIPATGQPIFFTEETDRIYHGKVESITIDDPGFARCILIRPRNSRSTVVWNPWIAKSQRMPDFGDHEYLHMCCVETANIAPHQMSMAPGEQTAIAVSIAAHNHCA